MAEIYKGLTNLALDEEAGTLGAGGALDPVHWWSGQNTTNSNVANTTNVLFNSYTNIQTSGPTHSAGRITTPSGVTYAELILTINWEVNATGSRNTFFELNSVKATADGWPELWAEGSGENDPITYYLRTGLVAVSPGDTLAVTNWQNSGVTLAIRAYSSLNILWYNI